MPLFDFDMTPNDQVVHCSSCGWFGPAGDLGLEVFEAVIERNCPKCDARYELLTIPTIADLETGAAAGSQNAIDRLKILNAPDLVEWRNSPLISEAADVPAVMADTFDVVIEDIPKEELDNENHPWLRVLANSEEIWRQPLFWEGYEIAIRLIKSLHKAFGTRMRSLTVSEGVLFYSEGDVLRSVDRMNEAIRIANSSAHNN